MIYGGPKKLFCYVDETGQDTLGRIFVVSVVVSSQERELLTEALERVERNSGKGRVKWAKVRAEQRRLYIKGVLASPLFKDSLYFCTYSGSRAYMALTVLSTAKAILSAAPQHAGTTVYVDGLPKARLRWFGAELRRLSVRNSKVMGVRREEADPLMRLADSIAGLVRAAIHSKQPDMILLFERALSEGCLREV